MDLMHTLDAAEAEIKNIREGFLRLQALLGDGTIGVTSVAIIEPPKKLPAAAPGVRRLGSVQRKRAGKYMDRMSEMLDALVAHVEVGEEVRFKDVPGWSKYWAKLAERCTDARFCFTMGRSGPRGNLVRRVGA